MRISLGSKFHVEPGSVLEIISDITIGGISGMIRSIYIMITFVYVNILRPIGNHIFQLHIPDGKRPKHMNGTLKVAAIGFGRTGTYSVTLALEELGYPTLHTIHMYAYENEEILHMWSHKVVDPAFALGQPILGVADLQLIAQSGYEAIADLPSVLFFEQIYKEYPNCKFILTTRENSEIWYKSWQTLTKSVTTSMFLGGKIFPTLNHYSRYFRWMMALVNNDVKYMTSTFPISENIKENAIAFYENHNRRVRELIPPDQLLEFNVKDGWGPLCTFLEIDNDHCPTTPFPKTNTAGQMRAQSASAFWIATFILLYLINRFRKSIFTSSSSSSLKTKKA